jgi:hypothetical protein
MHTFYLNPILNENLIEHFWTISETKKQSKTNRPAKTASLKKSAHSLSAKRQNPSGYYPLNSSAFSSRLTHIRRRIIPKA